VKREEREQVREPFERMNAEEMWPHQIFQALSYVIAGPDEGDGAHSSLFTLHAFAMG